MPTLDEIAELAGTSRATVSRVVNGGSVSAGTRTRVMAVLEATNYRPNAAARVLASGRSGVVGVVLHQDPHVLFGDRYFATLLQGVSDVLADRSSGMMLWLGGQTREETLARILGMSLLDGLIVTANLVRDSLVDGLIASRIPTVLVGHRRSDRSASFVAIDDVAAADTIVTHLVRTGRRRIGHIAGAPDTVAAADRITGYRQALARARVPFDESLLVGGDYTDAAGAAGAAILLERGVDAIFCANDSVARGALAVLAEAGRRVPEEIAVAGFDDLDFAATLEPALTTMRQNIRLLGTMAAETLLDLVAAGANQPRRVLLPTELVIRASTMRP